MSHELRHLRFDVQAEGIDTLVSEVSRMANGEKALTKECGYLLSKTYSSQVDKTFLHRFFEFFDIRRFCECDCLHLPI